LWDNCLDQIWESSGEQIPDPPKWPSQSEVVELLNIENWNSQCRKLFVRQLFGSNLAVFQGTKFQGPPRGRQYLVQTIVSQATSYIMSFNFLCWAVQKFHFRRAIFGGRGAGPPRGTPNLISWKTAKFGPNNCLANNFLHCEFQLSILNSSKVLLWGGGAGICPQNTPNLVQTIVSQTSSSFNIVCFNFLLYSAVQVSFWRVHLLEDP